MIDKIENEVLEGDGNAQEKLYRIYGKKVAYNTAKLYLTGIKLHLNMLKKLENREDIPPEKHKEVSFHQDNSKTIKTEIHLTEDEAASPTKIMQKMGLDPFLWEVISCKITDGGWDVTLKIENSEKNGSDYYKKTSTPQTVRNRKYSVILTVKPLGDNLTFPQILDAFKELEPVTLSRQDYKDIPSNTGLLFELPMMDFHLGKLSWLEETRQDYDLKIAEKLWRKVILDLINKALSFGEIEKIIFPVGQDFFHFDTPRGTTTAGTQLDTDTRWQKMFRKGVELLVWAIEELVKIAPVEVMWIPGNHDQMLSYAAVIGLYQRYYESQNVTVNTFATPRKYILFGKNLIGYSHGDKEGKRLQGLMQIEAPDLWGKSIFREFHIGHLHTEMTVTNNGIIFRQISSITASDAWHGENGFLGSTRQAQAFIWDKEFGLQAILNSNVKEKA